MNLTLHNKVSMPSVGLGTYQMRGSEAEAAVKSAVSEGLRLIDTASIYKVGQATERTHASRIRQDGCRTTI